MPFDDMQLAEFVALVQQRGIRFDPAWVDRYDERSGVFLPYAAGGPCIRISRPRSEQDPATHEWVPNTEQRREALFTLAHEFGHALSWLADKEQWKLVHAAVLRKEHLKMLGASLIDGLTAAQRTLILDEEVLAWSKGRSYVVEQLHPRYDIRAEEMLDGYRSAFGQPEG